MRISFVVGAAINLPGPFYLLALGDLATGYTTAEQLIMIALFNAIMFILLEIPLVGYAVDANRTARAVRLTAIWLNANGLRVVGALAGVFGLGLVVQGLTGTA